MTAAIALVVDSGLPDRADFSGQPVANLGWVAPEVGSLAPPFTLKTPEGDVVDLLSEQGRVVIVNFWATWCVPCEIEMPELQQVHEEYDAGTLMIIAINMGENGDTARTWADARNLTFTVALDVDGEVQATYRLRGQPSTYVVAPDGRIDSIYYGPTTAAALRASVDRAASSGIRQSSTSDHTAF